MEPKENIIFYLVSILQVLRGITSYDWGRRNLGFDSRASTDFSVFLTILLKILGLHIAKQFLCSQFSLNWLKVVSVITFSFYFDYKQKGYLD